MPSVGRSRRVAIGSACHFNPNYYLQCATTDKSTEEIHIQLNFTSQVVNLTPKQNAI